MRWKPYDSRSVVARYPLGCSSRGRVHDYYQQRCSPRPAIGGTAAMAGGFQVHQVTERDGVMTTRPLSSGLEIKPGETVTLKPGGLHIMFTGLKMRPKQGERFKVTLTFERAGSVEVEYVVQGIGASRFDHGDRSPSSPPSHSGH